MKIIVFIVITLSFNFLYSQNDINEHEIIIEKEFQVNVEEAHKINLEPEIEIDFQEKIDQSELKYDLPDRVESFVFEPTTIKSNIDIVSDNLPQISNYFKFGLGTKLNPYLELNHYKNISQDKVLYIYAKHNSNWISDIKYQRYSNTNFNLSTNLKIKEFNIKPQFIFDNKYYSFFGNINNYELETDKQRFFNNLELKTNINKKLISKYNLDLNIDANIGLGLDKVAHIDDDFNKEILLGFKTKLGFEYKPNISFGVNFKNTYLNSLYNTNYTKNFSSIGIETKINSNKLKLSAEANILRASFDGKSKFYALPKILTETEVFQNFVYLYTIWSRELELNNIHKTLQFNQFAIYNQKIPYSRIEKRSAGFKGFYKGFGYNTSFNQKIIKDAILFKNDFLEPRYMYSSIESSLTITEMNLEFTNVLNKMISTHLKGSLFFYETETEELAYNLPSNLINCGLSFKPLEKIIVGAELFVLSGVKTKILDNIVKTPFQVDLNLNSEYKLLKNWHALLNINNLFNTKVQNFYNYNSYGINLQVGFKYIY